MTVKAKRLGWNDTGEDPDRTPYEDMGYESDDLEGELAEWEFAPGKKVVLVGGQEADPDTVEEV